MEELRPRLPELRIDTTAADELKRREEERIRGAVERVVAVIDDVLEEFGLGHPASAIVELFEDISPYSILTRKLGIPAPGDVLDYVRYVVAATWKQLPPLLPKPAGAPEIRKFKE